MLTGPFYYRTLFGHAPITRDTTRQVVSYILRVIEPTGDSKTLETRLSVPSTRVRHS
jgi:hypothetical protein